VHVEGSSFSKVKSDQIRLELGDDSTRDLLLDVKDEKTATFVMPKGGELGLRSVSLVRGNTLMASFSIKTDQVAGVTYSPESGKYRYEQPIILTSSTEESSIYYTLDGSNPNTDSLIYKAPIVLSKNQTIKAFAVKPGLIMSATTMAVYTIDTKAPEVSNASIATRSPGSTRTPKVSFNLDEDATVTLFMDNSCTIPASNPSQKPAGSTDMFTSDLPVNSPVTLYASAMDNWGNAGECVFIGTYVNDSQPPTVAINSDLQASITNSTIHLSIVFSEDVTGFTIADIITSNATKNNFQGAETGRNFSVDISPVSHGMATVDIPAGAAQDLANSDSDPASTFSVFFDLDGPVFTEKSVISASPSSTNRTPTVGFHLSENANVTLYSDSSCSANIGGPEQKNQGEQTMITKTLASNVSTQIYIRGIDRFGNASNCEVIGTYTTDNQSPTFSNPSIQGPNPGKSENPRVNFELDEPAAVQFFSDENCNISISGPTQKPAGTSDLVTSNITLNDTTRIFGTATDQLNNKSNCTLLGTYINDTLPPTVLITSSASNPTSASILHISLNFSEQVAGFNLADMIVSKASKTNFQELVPGLMFSVDILPEGHGIVTVDIPAGAAQDVANNDSVAATTFSIFHDTQGPIFTEKSILSASPSTTNLTPTVGFTLDDDASVSLYSDSNCTNNIGGPTQKAQGAHTMSTSVLSDSNMTPIYIQGYDSLGNVSSCDLIGTYVTQLPPPTLANPSINVHQLSLNWLSKAGESYVLFWSTQPSVSNSSNQFNNVLPIYNHTNLDGGTYYYYRVAAVKNGVVGELSNEVFGAPDFDTPVITITSQPTNQSASQGMVTFEVSATATENGSLNYQWQRSIDGGVTFSNILGANSRSLAQFNLTTYENNQKFQVVIGADRGATSVTSSVATLTVSCNWGSGQCGEIKGCTDSSACNYSSTAQSANLTCAYNTCSTISGCTSSTACNYNPLANLDDGSCSTSCSTAKTSITLPGFVDAGTLDSNATDGDFIWQAYRSTSFIEKRKRSDGSLVQSVSLTGSTSAPCLTKAGDFIWAFNLTGQRTAWRINRTTYAFTKFTNTTPAAAQCFSGDGTYIWISDYSARKIHKLDGASGATLATVDLSTFMTRSIYGIATDNDKLAVVNGDGILVFISKQDLSILRKVILPASYFNQSVASIGANPFLVYGGGYWFVAPSGLDNTTMYRYDYSSNTGFVINQTFQSVEAIASSPEGLWIANTHAYNGAYVYLVSYEGRVMRRIPIGTLYSISSYPKVYFAPDNKLWITDYSTKLHIVPRPSP